MRSRRSVSQILKSRLVFDIDNTDAKNLTKSQLERIFFEYTEVVDTDLSRCYHSELESSTEQFL